MNPGFRGWARPRNRKFVGAPQTIDTTNGNTFRHGLGHKPGSVQVRLLVVTAANGYLAGEEVPVELLSKDVATDSNGSPRWSVRVTDLFVIVRINGTSIQITESDATEAAVTLSNYKVVVRCDDIERLK